MCGRWKAFPEDGAFLVPVLCDFPFKNIDLFILFGYPWSALLGLGLSLVAVSGGSSLRCLLFRSLGCWEWAGSVVTCFMDLVAHGVCNFPG